MTGLAWVFFWILRLCPEVTTQRERIFSNKRKWNEWTAATTNIHSPSFTADANFELRKKIKLISTSWKLLFMKYRGEQIGNCKVFESMTDFCRIRQCNNCFYNWHHIFLFLLLFFTENMYRYHWAGHSTHEAPLSMVIWVPSWYCLWCLFLLREKCKKPHLDPSSDRGSRDHTHWAL